MSTTQTEGQYAGDWLKYEVDPHSRVCREEITILAGSGADRVLASGTVLGKLTSGGKYVMLDPDASNGAEDAAGILLNAITAPDVVDAQGVAIVRGPCVVSAAGLVWTEDTDLN